MDKEGVDETHMKVAVIPEEMSSGDSEEAALMSAAVTHDNTMSTSPMKKLENWKNENRKLKVRLMNAFGVELSELKEVLLDTGDIVHTGEDDATKLVSELEREKRKNQNLRKMLLRVCAATKKLDRVEHVGVVCSGSASVCQPGLPDSGSASELDEALTTRTSGFWTPAHCATRSKRYWNDKMNSATSTVKCHIENETRKSRTLLEQKFTEIDAKFLEAKAERGKLSLQLENFSKDQEQVKQGTAEGQDGARRILDQGLETLFQHLAEERSKLAEDRDKFLKEMATYQEEMTQKFKEELKVMTRNVEKGRTDDIEKSVERHHDLKRKLDDNTELLQKAVKIFLAREEGGAAVKVNSHSVATIFPATAVHPSVSSSVAEKGTRFRSCGQRPDDATLTRSHGVVEVPSKVQCPVCGTTFGRLMSLNCHLKTMHGVEDEDLNKARCDQCNTFFRTVEAKKNHRCPNRTENNVDD